MRSSQRGTRGAAPTRPALARILASCEVDASPKLFVIAGYVPGPAAPSLHDVSMERREALREGGAQRPVDSAVCSSMHTSPSIHPYTRSPRRTRRYMGRLLPRRRDDTYPTPPRRTSLVSSRCVPRHTGPPPRTHRPRHIHRCTQRLPPPASRRKGVVVTVA